MANPVVFFDLALGGMFCLSHVILISIHLRLLCINSSQVARGLLSLIHQMLFGHSAVRPRGGSSARGLGCAQNLTIIQHL